MERARSTSSVSAPPSSRGSSLASAPGNRPSWGVVHTGFSTSSDGDSRGASHDHAPPVRQVVHTGFTTSEDSYSQASRSRASSPSVSRASSTAVLFAGVLAKRPSDPPHDTTRPNLEEANAPSRVESSAVVATPWDRAVDMRILGATSARPLDQPRKADHTPRRKVSPVAPIGSHKTTDQTHSPPSASSGPLIAHSLTAAGSSLPNNCGGPHRPLWGSTLPPSTLLDLQMRLEVLSNTQLTVREEELVKELLRTQQELRRRGLTTTTEVRNPATTVDTRVAGEDHAGQQDDSDQGPSVTEEEDEATSVDGGEFTTRPRTPRSYHQGGEASRRRRDTPVSPAASRLREYAQNLLDMTQNHMGAPITGGRDTAATPRRMNHLAARLFPASYAPHSAGSDRQSWSPLLKSPIHHQHKSAARAPLPVQAHPSSRRIAPSATYDRSASHERTVRGAVGPEDAYPYGYPPERKRGGGAQTPKSGRDGRSTTPPAAQTAGRQQPRRHFDTPPPVAADFGTTSYRAAYHRDDPMFSAAERSGSASDDVWNELAVLRRIRTE